MNNYITDLIEILPKTSNRKGHIISEAQRVKEFQKTVLIQITETEMLIKALTGGYSMKD